MPKKSKEDKTKEGSPHKTGASDGLLSPFLDDAFSKALLVFLIPAVTACIFARAPQYRLTKVLGQELPVPIDAVTAILIFPLYFFLASWLLRRAASRSGISQSATPWTKADIRIVAVLLALFGLTALFLLAQFFLVLAPAGTCDQRPHLKMLWTIEMHDRKVEHCMSSARETNEKAWYYLRPTLLQVWGNILLLIFGMRFVWQAWRAWLGRIESAEKLGRRFSPPPRGDIDR